MNISQEQEEKIISLWKQPNGERTISRLVFGEPHKTYYVKKILRKYGLKRNRHEATVAGYIVRYRNMGKEIPDIRIARVKRVRKIISNLKRKLYQYELEIKDLECSATTK